MLETESIVFSYNNSHEFQFPDIQLSKGEDLLILGNSGVGKTTMVHLLAGLLRPKSGSIKLNETDYHSLSALQLDQFRGRHIGMIFQSPHFVRNLSVINNLLLALHLGKQKQDKKRALEILAQLGLEHKANERPYSLSQGEQQRVAIALAVVKNPDMILADEPTSSLDDDNCNKTISLLREQASATNAQLIIITHDQRLKDQFQKSIWL